MKKILIAMAALLTLACASTAQAAVTLTVTPNTNIARRAVS